VKRLVLSFVLSFMLLAAGTARAAGPWSELWQTADQRGEALLREGQPAAAAKVFSDPRRRAYAELKAGDYAAAAKGFEAFDDREAHYDRGNALARAGDLQNALKAYDAALKLDPQDKDARHNRDLVAKALEQQKQKEQGSPQPQSKPQQQQAKPGDKPPPQPGSNGDDPQKQAASPPPQSGASAASKPSSQDNSKAGQKPEASASSASSQPTPAEAASSAGNGEKQAAEAQARSEPSAPDAAASSPADSEAQARRDVDRGTAASSPRASGGASAPQRAGETTPRSERQLAEDQWLRRIPDDPGGLLRRKFMIQHMQRQQSQQLSTDPESSR
jgi:Ca-activated chloride channel homolog